MERSDGSSKASIGRLEGLLQRICGHPREFTVEHQVQNWLMFFAIFMYAASGLENTLLGLSPTWELYVASVVVAAGYYLVRFRRLLRMTFGVALIVTWMLISIPAWFTSDGIGGSTPVYFLLGILAVMSLIQGKARWWVVGVALLLLEFAVLTGVQIAYPPLIRPYRSMMTRDVDISFSFGVVMVFEIGHLGILSYNLNQRRRQADDLLLNILPGPIAEQLKFAPKQTIAESIPQASVLFADLVNFTPLSASMSAGDLVDLLNEVFSQFDQLVEKRGLEKIKTIGDCYMVAAGAPQPRHDHAEVLVELALEMQSYVRGREFKGRQLAFRFGINSGPLIAGVIGRKKFSYDLWGDTVNTASRMESHGVNGGIQITEATQQLIQERFSCEPRGMIPVKGKGEMPVWLVVDRKHS
jgi:guanylate cyclase